MQIFCWTPIVKHHQLQESVMEHAQFWSIIKIAQQTTTWVCTWFCANFQKEIPEQVMITSHNTHWICWFSLGASGSSKRFGTELLAWGPSFDWMEIGKQLAHIGHHPGNHCNSIVTNLSYSCGIAGQLVGLSTWAVTWAEKSAPMNKLAHPHSWYCLLEDAFTTRNFVLFCEQQSLHQSEQPLLLFACVLPVITDHPGKRSMQDCNFRPCINAVHCFGHSYIKGTMVTYGLKIFVHD